MTHNRSVTGSTPVRATIMICYEKAEKCLTPSLIKVFTHYASTIKGVYFNNLREFVCGTPTASKTVDESSILSTPANFQGHLMHNKSFLDIIKEEIADETEATLKSIEEQERRLEMSKETLKRLHKEAACDDHTFEVLGGGMQAEISVCSKCGRTYYY